MTNETAIITTTPPVIQWAQDEFDSSKFVDICLSEKTFDAIAAVIAANPPTAKHGYCKVGDLWWKLADAKTIYASEAEDENFTLYRGVDGWGNMFGSEAIPGELLAWPGENLEVAN